MFTIDDKVPAFGFHLADNTGASYRDCARRPPFRFVSQASGRLAVSSPSGSTNRYVTVAIRLLGECLDGWYECGPSALADAAILLVA
jgi:hypothetical protein